MSLSDVPDRVSWREAVDLADFLVIDPGRYTCAAMQGWDHPMTRTEMILADLIDITAKVGDLVDARTRTAFTYPRPWPEPGAKSIGKGTSIPVDEFKDRWNEILARLERRGD